MPRISFLKPVDQPSGAQRILDELQAGLESPHFAHLRLAVAFAKAGPLLRLLPYLEAWKKAGKSIEAIMGIDHQGTSQQALEIALRTFDRTFVLHSSPPPNVTFHPKFYLFYGDRHATCLVGSHNLTVGGTETNFETGVKLALDLETDEALFDEAVSCWTSLLPEAVGNLTQLLDAKLLAALSTGGFLLDETMPAPRSIAGSATLPYVPRGSGLPDFPTFTTKPPRAIPGGVMLRMQPSSTETSTPAVASSGHSSPIPQVFTPILVIQIVVHYNGEILLSKKAIDQNPSFFGFPFTGSAAPKKAGNPPYPQRIPDPVVDIMVVDVSGAVVTKLEGFGLNMVYYEAKHEIRITVPPEVRTEVEPYSVMLMERCEPDSNRDYDIRIYSPGADEYNRLIAVCDQTLPSGGAAKARRMGWL